MINGFLTFVTKRRQAYMGQPANKIYYDEKAKRYRIEGEEESEDEAPPPPPPMTRKKAEPKEEEE